MSHSVGSPLIVHRQTTFDLLPNRIKRTIQTGVGCKKVENLALFDYRAYDAIAVS
jgi:hypothetical protein